MTGRKPFSQLPKRKREFVRHYVRSGDAYEAYCKAGYKISRAARAQARKLQVELQPYIREQVAEYISGAQMAIMGLKVVEELALNSESDVVRLNAAKEMLSRSIPETPKEVHHHHTSDKKELSDDELLSRLKKLQDKLFIDAPAIEVVNEPEEPAERPRGIPVPVGGVGVPEDA